MNVCFSFDFHPVGQGLFASGCLYQANTPEPQFLWVYDCGSLTHRDEEFWDAAIDNFKVGCRQKQSINLLTLSHFDDDHITGLTTLLKKFSVDTLLLPHVPLWERLLVAFGGNIINDNGRMDYLLDPITYIRNLGEIGRIIVVGSGDEGPPLAEGAPNIPVSPEGKWKLDVKTKDFRSENPSDDYREFGTKADTAEFLPSGQLISVCGFWEFCPYNAPRTPSCEDFREHVEQLREELLDADADKRKEALDILKDYYDDNFGGDARNRNEISLFLYAGPIYNSWQQHKTLLYPRSSFPGFPMRYPCYWRVHAYALGHTLKCSILYSGDAYLNTARKFDALERYLTLNRMRQLCVFQVNHHGAKGNWHRGLASKIHPVVSVFSSEPTRGPTNHPHAEVLLDYQPFSPIQVNNIGCSQYGWLLAKTI